MHGLGVYGFNQTKNGIRYDIATFKWTIVFTGLFSHSMRGRVGFTIAGFWHLAMSQKEVQEHE